MIMVFRTSKISMIYLQFHILALFDRATLRQFKKYYFWPKISLKPNYFKKQNSSPSVLLTYRSKLAWSTQQLRHETTLLSTPVKNLKIIWLYLLNRYVPKG